MNKYFTWLVLVSLVGGLTGWLIQSYVMGSYIIWVLPAYCIANILFTLNGDSIIEACVIMLIFGLIALGLNGFVSDKVGPGIVLGIYSSLFISKVAFALVKGGFFGNETFK